MKELIQRLQSEKIPNEEKPVEKVKFFAEEVREKIQNEKNPEEKPKNTVQSEKTQNGKNSTHLEEFWAEFDENSETEMAKSYFKLRNFHYRNILF